jgi:hypothetical protein
VWLSNVARCPFWLPHSPYVAEFVGNVAEFVGNAVCSLQQVLEVHVRVVTVMTVVQMWTVVVVYMWMVTVVPMWTVTVPCHFVSYSVR